MKKTKIIFSILMVMAILLGACTEKFLDKTRDENKVSPKDYWVKPQDAFRTLIGAYCILKYNGLNGPTIQVPMHGMDPNVTHEGGADYIIFQSFNFFTDNKNIQGMYQPLNAGMFRCNLAIQKIPLCFNGQYATPENLLERQYEMGEAYFLRAYYAFQLTSLFYEPPCLYQIFDDNDEYKNLTNMSQAKWIDSIKKDLRRAIDSLPNSWPPADQGRVTKAAAWALLGKTHMLAANYDSAEIAFNKIINEKVGNHDLIKPQGTDSLDYVYAYLCNYSMIDLENGNKVYPAENNQESLLETQEGIEASTWWNLSLDGYGAVGSLYTSYFSILGYWNIGARTSFINKYEKVTYVADSVPLNYDARKYATVYLPGDTIKCVEQVAPCGEPIDKIGKLNKANWASAVAPGNTIKKYMYPMYPYTTSNSKTDPTNHRLITYSDVLLLAAEVKYQLGKNDDALGYLNQLRNRVGLPSKTSTAAADIKSMIIREREMEKAMEATWPLDLMRWGRTKDQIAGGLFVNPASYMTNFKANKHEYFPIPQQEIDRMTGVGLRQNPGW